MGAHVLWAVVFGFLIGVFARSNFNFSWSAIAFPLVVAIATMLAARLGSVHQRSALIIAVALFAFSGGVVRMHMGMWESHPLFDASIGSEVSIEGVVTAEPDERENNVRIRVRAEMIASTTMNTPVSILVIAPLHTQVRYGDRVIAKGMLRAPKAFETGDGRAFDYPAYLAKDGILYELAFAQAHKIGDTRKNLLKSFAIWMKQKYLDGLSMALPEPAAGLAGGITAGDKRGLGKDLSDVFRTVGLVHIVVLSGYNIMIVIGFIERIFSSLRVWMRSVLGVAIAVLFALMTGLASSSVRAASMAVIATAGKTTGRVYLAERALAVVAFGMVLWNPYVLAFDPGFQLSVLATIGLLFISPVIAARLRGVTERFGLREIMAATLGTQTAVLPLLLYQNGLLSIYSLPTNLFVLVAVPYAMLLSFFAGLFGEIAGPLAPIIGFPAYTLLSYIISVARFFASLPYASLAIPSFSFMWVIASYALLICAVLMQKKAAKPSRASP